MKRFVQRAAAASGEMIPVITTNVDVFDALFISKCMQNSASFWMSAGLIFLDAVETVHNLKRLRKVAQQCQHTQSKCRLDSVKRICSYATQDVRVPQEQALTTASL